MSAARFSLIARLRSFGFALSGLGFMLRTQHNAWIHLAATVLVALAGLALGVSASDWRWLTLAIALVWVAEAMNTAFEHLCDVVSPAFHVSVQRCKDVAAGAVLVCAIAAAVVGALTLLPYLAPYLAGLPVGRVR
jgi:diacylglycerol kinase (ATP)